MVRTGKQVRTNVEKVLEHNVFNLKIGSTNKYNPMVIYIEGKTYITPNEEKESYVNDIKDVRFALKRHVTEILCRNKIFQNNYIIDFQLADGRMKKNKKSFLTFEVLLKQIEDNVLKIEDVISSGKDDIYDMVDTVERCISEKHFSMSKTKA